ncbi:phage head-tail family protein, putative (macronuclear) [Tetrahymena thermophila SB210]|uniref:Phage head-tail family protein, putative n=1 Tax=Tetrahymena thermophila (strain SB210) TaxID=312017 RepID=Q231V7_TETTS|nr:phage head-tail family protein, putative [Tetrahymena thermophila SB210]EAR91343.2 phage head-tail family protein, putative [Tetrahymena thermophila SB210]|eukprot:XP_001011588.2 phage head-tail family protein, putative [Tetrahymena thermophila SB210]
MSQEGQDSIKTQAEHNSKQLHRGNAISKSVNFEKIPGDIFLAKEHLKATKVGPDKEFTEKDKQQGFINEKCDCCGRSVDREILNLNSDITKLSYLGSGFPMFFQFLKFCIFFLLILFCVCGIFNMVANANYGNQCNLKGNQCKTNWIVKLSLGNRTDLYYSIYIQECLNLTAVCVLIIFIQIIIYQQRMLDSDSDDSAILASDYTVMVENIPKDIQCENDLQKENLDYDDELKSFFQNPSNFNGYEFKVIKVNLGYEIKDLTHLQRKQKLFVNDKKKLFKSQISKNGKYDIFSQEAIQIDKQIEIVKSEILKLENRLSEGKGVEFMKNLFTGVAFVTFETERMQKDLLEMAKSSWNCFKKSQTVRQFMGTHLRISAAPDPTEIFWENLGVSKTSRAIRVVVGLIVDSFMVFGCGLSIYFLLDYQSSYAKNHNVNSISDSTLRAKEIRNIQLLSFTISIVIFIINQFLVILVKTVADFKKLQTRTNYNLSFAFFLSLAQFTNATLVPLIVSFIVHQNTNYQMLYGASGLIPTQNTIFMVNSFLPVLFFIFDIQSIIKKYLRKKQESSGESSILTQQELLELYEDPAFAIQSEYSQIMKTLLMTLFYATPLPICIFWSILGLIIQYFIAKYNLLYRRSAPFNMGSSLGYKMVLLMNIGLVIYACLSYVFIILSKDNDDNNPRTVSFVAIAIASIHLFLPAHIINKKIFKVKSKKPENTKIYQEVQGSFSTDYDRTNPATRRQANQKFVEEQEAVVQNIFQQEDLINFDSKNKSEFQGTKKDIQLIEENIKFISVNNEVQFQKQEGYIQHSIFRNLVELQNHKNDQKDDSNLHVINLKDESYSCCQDDEIKNQRNTEVKSLSKEILQKQLKRYEEIKNGFVELFYKNKEKTKNLPNKIENKANQESLNYKNEENLQVQDQEQNNNQISINIFKCKQVANKYSFEQVINFEDDQSSQTQINSESENSSLKNQKLKKNHSYFV